MYYYIKALHIIFIVTWFSGMFYIVRLFIYVAEANLKQEPDRSILKNQLLVMSRRLWLGIAWPSAVLTLIFGGITWYLLGSTPGWLIVKLAFVAGLFAYHLSLNAIFRQQKRDVFKYSSNQLRIWNELATVFLVAIVMLVVVKQTLSWVWGLTGLIMLVVLLMTAIKIYKRIRKG